jgi:FMN phosphatase YigB (HAD superfamily)
MKEHGYVPSELLMVGDNPQTDIKPANELGIITAMVKYGQVFPIDSNDRFQFPDYYLKSLWELVDLLKKA